MKTWLIIVILAAAAFLCWVLFRGCNALPSHQDGKNTVDSVNTAYAREKAVQFARIDSLTHDDLIKTRQVDSLTTAIRLTEQQLSAKGAAISGTIANGQRYRVLHDTVKIIANCDSLASQVEAGIISVGGYERLMDSLISAGQEQARTKDSLTASYRGLWQKSDQSLGIVTGQYNSLFSDYTKANRRLKFNKGLSRVLAAAVLAGAIKIFILK